VEELHFLELYFLSLTILKIRSASCGFFKKKNWIFFIWHKFLSNFFLFSYGVSAVIGGEESEPTAWEEFKIPPRGGSAHQPKLTVIDNKNDTINLVINQSPTNNKCEVSFLND